MTYWSSYSASKDANSWFTVETKAPVNANSPRPKWRAEQPLWQVITENEQCKKEENANVENAKKKRKPARSRAKKTYKLPRARKVRVYPRKGERETLKQWFGVARRAYNTAAAVHRAVESKEGKVWDRVVESTNEVKRDKQGRPIVKVKVNKKNGLYHPTRGMSAAKKEVARQMEREDGIDWVLKVPQVVRDSAIRDFEKAVASGKAKNEEKQASGEEQVKEKFKFRTRKDSTQTFEFNARDFNRAGGKIKG
ncbi:MAG: helix-turn-helix domain-containing protein, partial [Hyphomicrobiales bacterium]|nr:helix-turn-helix domain-containing protein [Hyphomicrobiales bacterium]